MDSGKPTPMKNFLRALKFAWPYRNRVFLSVFCALVVAVLWGLNFTAIYPILKILGSGENLQTWVNNSIERTEKDSIRPLEKRIDELNEWKESIAKNPEALNHEKDQRNCARLLAQNETKLEAARQELYRYRVAKKYID